MQKAFLAAEDKRFYEHKGVDVRSVTRAFMNTMGGDKRQGGSTITQQVAKNLLVGDSVTFERKIREVIVAARLEKAVSKQEILEIYLNSIYLGRSSWGVDLAARSYFGKPVKDVDLNEAAFLAGLTKGPAYFNPDKYRDRAQERLAYVLTRMKDDGSITEPQMTEAEAAKLNFVPNNRVRRNTGFHLVDEVGREARAVAGINSLTSNSYQVRSTIRPGIQRAAEAALQDGLAQYEQNAGRVEFQGAETNIGDAIRKLDAERRANPARPGRPEQAELAGRARAGADAALRRALDAGGGGRAQEHPGRRIDPGRSARRPRAADLDLGRADALADQSQNDVVYVKVVESPGQKGGPRVELRTRPQVQGVALVMENKTGRMLAMVGGFSYPLSQLNRVTQSRRQPGSSLKPLIYLAALTHGLQPNTLIQDSPITYPPIGGVQPLHAPDRLVVAAQLRRRLCRLDDDAPRARAIEEPRHRAPARRRHREHAEGKPRCDLRACGEGAGLSAMRALLSVRARRPAGAADRSRCVLRRDRQRGPAPHPARDRADLARRPRGLQGQRNAEATSRRRRRRRRSSFAASCRASSPAAPRRGSARCRTSSPARPAPATSSTTPGSSASARTSPSRSGSATTTPA